MNPAIIHYGALPHLGLIRVSGPDAATLLQGQVTNDVRTLQPGTSGCGAFCNPKGRVIANFHISRANDGFYLWLAADLAGTVSKRLRMYVLRAQAVIEDLSPTHRIIGLEETAPGTWRSSRMEEDAAITLKLPEARGRLLLALEPGHALPVGLTEAMDSLKATGWQLADIEAGWPLVVAATSEAFLPQMLNLDLMEGVSFNKGCYTGQEIVTRTRFLGQVKRRLYRLAGTGTDIPAPGTPIHDAATPEAGAIGQIVNAVADDASRFQCLAVLGVEHAASPALRLAAVDGSMLTGCPLPQDAVTGLPG